MRERMPLALAELLDRLHRAGFEAYPVGGCVRDLLRGITPHDWDVTTSALPQQVKTLFTDCRVVETGIAHGTVTVITGGCPVEITSFRGEGAYSDSRHPDTVCFGVTLAEDLSRRDFTIGAMAWDTAENRVIDPYGGREDLANGILRAVGEPEHRFEEDALRILRGLRFAATLELTIEPETAAAMRNSARRLKMISPERIRTELEKLLCGVDTAAVLREYIDMIGTVLPELLPMVGFLQHNSHHDRDVWEHTLTVLSAVSPEPVLRWAALLHDAAKPECFTMDEQGVGHFSGHPAKSAAMAEKVLRRLRCENRFIADVAELVRIHDERLPAEKRVAVRWAGRWGEERFRQFLELRRADTLGKANAAVAGADDYRARMLRFLEEAKAEGACFTLRELAVRGDDLLELGIRGAAVGQALNALLEQVQDGLLPNDRETLLQAEILQAYTGIISE